MMYMKLKDYVRQMGHGTQGRLAKALGVSRVAIHLWAEEKRPVPVVRAVALERATGGEVTRQEVRPNDWQEFWPELAEQGAPTCPASC